MLYIIFFKNILSLFTPKTLFAVKIGPGQHFIYLCSYNKFDSPKKKEIKKKPAIFSSKTAGKSGKINNGFRTDNVLTSSSSSLVFMR